MESVISPRDDCILSGISIALIISDFSYHCNFSVENNGNDCLILIKT